jgi:DNA-binding CsgD family transcriptional regulator
VLRFVRELDDAPDETTYAREMLIGLERLIRYDAAGFNDLDLAVGTIRWLTIPREVEDVADRAALERNIDQHPLFLAFQRTRDSRAMKVWDFVRPRDFHATALYNDFYRDLSFEHQLISQWMVSPNRLFAVSLFRGKRDFSERDRGVFDLVQPHVVSGQRTVRARMRTRTLLAMFERSLERNGQNAVLTSAGGHIDLLVGGAEQWLESFFGRAPAGSLPEELAGWVSNERARHLTDAAAPRTARSLVKDGELGHLEVLFVPAASSAEPDALLLTLTPRDRLQHSAARLTRRETEIMAMVADGHSDAEIADALVIRPDTVKKHLQRIYRKLGVHSRTAALARTRGAACA